MSELLDRIGVLERKYKPKSVVKSDKKPHFLQLEVYDITLQDGTKFSREKMLKNGKEGSSAFILPITKQGKIVLICEPRVFTKRQVGFAIPAGYVEENEKAEVGAKRELLEETGYTCQSIKLINKFYQDMGCSSALNYLFIATGCEKVTSQHLDGDEHITYFEVTFDEAKQLVDLGYICDPQSILAINGYELMKLKSKYEELEKW